MLKLIPKTSRIQNTHFWAGGGGVSIITVVLMPFNIRSTNSLLEPTRIISRSIRSNASRLCVVSVEGAHVSLICFLSQMKSDSMFGGFPASRAIIIFNFAISANTSAVDAMTAEKVQSSH
jgi:hypothetical protein